MEKSEEMDKSGDETFLDKSGIDEIPLIIKPRLGSSPGKVSKNSSTYPPENKTLFRKRVVNHALCWLAPLALARPAHLTSTLATTSKWARVPNLSLGLQCQLRTRFILEVQNGLIIQASHFTEFTPIYNVFAGWSDSEGRSDNLVFKDLLRHMQDNQEYCVKAVVWCIMPTPRMDANLQAQAKFIDMFTPDDEKTTENEAGKIWNNVVIICKGKVRKSNSNTL